MCRARCSFNFMVYCWSACIYHDAIPHKKPEMWESSSGFAQASGFALISEPGGEENPVESWSTCTQRHWHSLLFFNGPFSRSGTVISI